MKFTTLYKAAFICLALIAGMLVFTAYSTPAQAGCQTAAEHQLAIHCSNSQQSWFSWFQGKSRSTQFHFVDLLELLSRLSPAK
ncbi:MAG: hypothetical protein KKE94_13885 [Gammaproteobacteria bacterium]|nr:hypothetical protein [Gammaproteobacteria bacterium]